MFTAMACILLGLVIGAIVSPFCPHAWLSGSFWCVQRITCACAVNAHLEMKGPGGKSMNAETHNLPMLTWSWQHGILRHGVTFHWLTACILAISVSPFELGSPQLLCSSPGPSKMPLHCHSRDASVCNGIEAAGVYPWTVLPNIWWAKLGRC